MKLDPLTSPRTYAALATLMAADAVIYAIPMQFVTEGLDRVRFPRQYRWIFPPIKLAAAIGLVSVNRFPWLARLTTAMMTLYFVLAVGSHIKARDLGGNVVGASTFLAISAGLTAKGPRTIERTQSIRR